MNAPEPCAIEIGVCPHCRGVSEVSHRCDCPSANSPPPCKRNHTAICDAVTSRCARLIEEAGAVAQRLDGVVDDLDTLRMSCGDAYYQTTIAKDRSEAWVERLRRASAELRRIAEATRVRKP